ncbi:MAG: hypothetical protein HRT88_19540, partial [Lentisphaeraceae bacterium]|nr:hypothetical protein [Lentisphaeraceae bacterium]
PTGTATSPTGTTVTANTGTAATTAAVSGTVIVYDIGTFTATDAKVSTNTSSDDGTTAATDLIICTESGAGVSLTADVFPAGATSTSIRWKLEGSDADNVNWTTKKGSLSSTGTATSWISQGPTKDKYEFTFTAWVDADGNDKLDSETTRSIKVKVYSLTMGINNTPKEDKDDYICVSSGPNRPFRTLEIDLAGPSGGTRKVYLKSAGDGEVEFDDAEPTVTVGTPTVIKLYGKTKSVKADSTKVEARLDQNGSVCETEDLTVFEGVKLKFSGTFYSNIDARFEGWRPWKGKLTQHGVTYIYNKELAMKEDNGEYIPVLVFGTKGMGLLPGRRTWSPTPKVEVMEVSSKDPEIILFGDPLIGSFIHTYGGMFEMGHPGGYEAILGLQIRISKGKETYLIGTNETHLEKIKIILDPSGRPLLLTKKISEAGFIAQVKGGGANIMNFYTSRKHKYKVLDKSTGLEHDATRDTVAFAVTQNRFQATYKNSDHKLSAGSSTDKSLAARCIISEQGSSTSTISCKFQRFNMWTLMGEIKEGVIE